MDVHKYVYVSIRSLNVGQEMDFYAKLLELFLILLPLLIKSNFLAVCFRLFEYGLMDL